MLSWADYNGSYAKVSGYGGERFRKIGGQMTDVRNQKSEDRSQRSEITPIEHPEKEPRLNGLPELNGVNKEAQKGNF